MMNVVCKAQKYCFCNCGQETLIDHLLGEMQNYH